MNSTAHRADLVMRIGAVLLVIGLICLLVAILPLFFPALSMPSIMWGLSMLIGLGIITIAVGLTMSARARRHQS